MHEHKWMKHARIYAKMEHEGLNRPWDIQKVGFVNKYKVMGTQ